VVEYSHLGAEQAIGGHTGGGGSSGLNVSGSGEFGDPGGAGIQAGADMLVRHPWLDLGTSSMLYSSL
jgi:hypothetical protein